MKDKIIKYLKGLCERLSDILYVFSAILQFIIGCPTFLCAAVLLAAWATVNLALFFALLLIACALHLPLYLFFNLHPIEIALRVWEFMDKTFYTCGNDILFFFSDYVFPNDEINWYEKIEDWVWEKRNVDIKIDE